MRERFLPIITTVAILLCGGVIAYSFIAPKTERYLKNQIPSVTIRDVGIDAMIADTSPERVQGLSGLSSIGPREGLLMIFEKSDFHAIWMKDMNFPIDIIWIDEDFTVVDITEAISPDTYPSIFEPSEPIRMALEVNARFAATHKLKVGDTVFLNEEYIPHDLKKTE